MSTIELFQSCLVVSNIQINQVFFYFWHTYLVYYIYVSKYQKKIASMLAISVFLRRNNIAINCLDEIFLLLLKMSFFSLINGMWGRGFTILSWVMNIHFFVYWKTRRYPYNYDYVDFVKMKKVLLNFP